MGVSPCYFSLWSMSVNGGEFEKLVAKPKSKSKVWKLFSNWPQMADEKFPTVLIQFEATWPYQRRNLAVQHLCYQQDSCHWTFLWWVKCWRSHRVQVCCEKRKSAAVAWGSCGHRSRHGAPHWFGTQRAGENVQTSTMSPYHYQRSESSECYISWYYRTPYCCHIVVWELEFYQRQNRHSSLPPPGAG